MCVAEEDSSVTEPAEGGNLKEARGDLVDALLQESREELERIDLKASILLSLCSLGLAALVHAAAYVHWDPRDLGGFQWFFWTGMALGGATLVVLAAAVWPRLGQSESEEEGLTYFGHVARLEDLEGLNAALDRATSAYTSRTDHAAKRLLALSKLVRVKYMCIRWGMVLFGVSVLLCAIAVVRALTP
jgi:hypothetical protein